MTEAQLSRYADLMLWCVGGVGDQNLVVRLEPEGRDLAVALAETAYRDGARLVDLAYSDPLEVRARLAHGSDEAVEALPDYYRARYDEIARPEWTAIRIKGSAHPDALAGNDAARIGAYSRAHRATMERLAAETAAFRKAWVGVLFPTAAVATKAFPELDEAAALEAYEAALVRVLHLDDDPVSFWSDHFASLARRRDRYNALALDRLRFTGPGTDLEIRLHPGGRWQTAEETLVDGRTVRVNMPSCEIFTTPDLRRTSGRVASTRPFVSTSAPGRTIEGAWLEFRDGAVVDHGAAEGGDLLGRVLDMDAQARYLGEVALVDASSPVAAESMVFHDVLYDENAACHIALGYGFPGLVSGTDGLEGAALVERGVNHSLVHDDLMIGGGEVDVTGVTADGREVPIMRSGLFVGE